MESVIYGFNCIVYGLCMFVLLRDGKSVSRHWVLILTSTLLFSLCTIHVAASLRQLLEAFVYVPADIPDYSNLYWLNATTSLSILKEVLYDTLVFIQDIVLIWRLYVVFDRNWKVVLFPIIVEATHMAAAYAATVIYTINPGISLYDSIVSRLGLTGWALDISLNVSLTMAIATRLWWMGHRVASLSASHPMQNRYLATVYVIIESGGLFAGATIIMLGLYVNNSPVTLTGLDVASQLAVLTPLLIVVRVGLGLTHGVQRDYERMSKSRTSGSRTMTSNTREIGQPMELTSMSSNSRSFAKDMKV